MLLRTYIINLSHRTDRRDSILKQFANRQEFEISIFNAVKDDNGAIGLWYSIQKIIQDATDKDYDYILICEDDHLFTESYNYKLLGQCISEAQANNADLISGGVSWFEDTFQISDSLFEVKKFSGFQFTIIFKRLYNSIKTAPFTVSDAADFKISALATNKFFIYPFISTQKDFGYSDVTYRNDGTNRVEELFIKTSKKIDTIKQIRSFYSKFSTKVLFDLTSIDINSITIPSYILSQEDDTRSSEYITAQFESRQEFQMNLFNICTRKTFNGVAWETVRKIVQLSIDNEDDVIIITDNKHQFTSDYSKEHLLINIIRAHEHGCDFLIGDIGKFDFVVPVSANLFWTNHCPSAHFLVIFRKLFNKIMNEPYIDNEETQISLKLSQITSHKMILYPPVSLRHDHTPADLTEGNNSLKETKVSDGVYTMSKERIDFIYNKTLQKGLFRS